MVTDRNYWATYRDSIATWYGQLPPPGKLGMERVFEFARHILEAAEREQVMRLIFVPARPMAQNEKVPTWLELMRARFEQEGDLSLFPFGIPHETLGGHFRQPARLAYYQGDRIIEQDVDDVGALEKSVVTARGGDPYGIRYTEPFVLGGGSHNEPDQPLSPGRPPTREIRMYLSLYTDIWFPRVVGLDVGDDAGRDPEARHPARGGDGLMDNSALAARHTPRLNRFIEALRDAILELGGTWGDPDVSPSDKPMVHRGGILLDYPAASA
jgi:hypothetical protein